MNPQVRGLVEDMLQTDSQLRLCVTTTQITELRKKLLHMEVDQAQAGKQALQLLEIWTEQGVLSPLVEDDEAAALVQHLARQEKRHAVWLTKPGALIDSLYHKLPQAMQAYVGLARCKQKKLYFFRADTPDEAPAAQESEVISPTLSQASAPSELEHWLATS